MRVFQQFATLDLLSGGRAEIMAGAARSSSRSRSSATTSPTTTTCSPRSSSCCSSCVRRSTHLERPPSRAARRPPASIRARCRTIPVWVAVGGTPESAARAGTLGLPMALAIIGGLPERFAPFAEIHRRAAAEAGHEPPALSINSHGFIADTSQEAAEVAWPSFAAMMDRIGRERGWPPMTREQFEASRTLRGANFVGSPQEVVEKILFQHEIFGHDRFLLQLTRRHAAAREHDARDRAVRHGGRARRAHRARPPGAGRGSLGVASRVGRSVRDQSARDRGRRDRRRGGSRRARRDGRARRCRPAGDPRRPGARAGARRPGVLVARRPVPRRQPRAATDADQGLARAGLAGLARHAPASTGPRTSGRAAGPRPTSTWRPARSAPGCTSRACACCRSSAGPSAAARLRRGHGNSVPRFHLTWGTGPGVARAVRAPGARGRSARARRAPLPPPRRRADDDRRRRRRRRGAVLEPTTVERGQSSSRDEIGDFELRAQAVIVTLGRHRRQPRARASQLARAPRPAADAHDLRRARPRRRAHDRDRARRPVRSVINPDRMWHYTEGIQNWDPIWPQHGIRILPGPSSLWLDATGRAAAGAVLPGLRHARDAASTSGRPATGTRGSCSPRRSSRRSSRSRAPNRTPTSRASPCARS